MLTPTGVTAAEYWNAIKSGNATHVRMTFTGQNIVLDDSDVELSGIYITDPLNTDTDLRFGKSVMKELSTKIIISDKTKKLKWYDEFKLEFGVEINGTTNWVTIGYFTGETPQHVTNERVVDFNAYDRMQMFETSAYYFAQRLSNIGYPITSIDLYHALCDYVGIEYVAGDEICTAHEVEEEPEGLADMSCREVLEMFAEAMGCYAKIDASGKCKLVWFSDHTDYEITPNEEFAIRNNDINEAYTWDEFDQLTWDEADGHLWNDIAGYQEMYNIDVLSVGGSYYPERYYISTNRYRISNPEASAPKNYYDRVVELGGYVPLTVDCIGNWLVEAGDIITVYVEDKALKTPIFYRTLHWYDTVDDTYEVTGSKKRKE